ncbi:MAG: hypothetical protein WCG23_11650 [bacterium]
MNWIIQSDYNELEELSCRTDLTEYEENRLEQLEADIYFYQTNYVKGGR